MHHSTNSDMFVWNYICATQNPGWKIYIRLNDPGFKKKYDYL
jgi:hypothetical protein